jgi:hypothetical protein
MAAKKKMTKSAKIKRLKRQKNSLYRNINLAKLGAGKKKKKGEKSSRPKDSDFKAAAKTAKKKPMKKRTKKRTTKKK